MTAIVPQSAVDSIEDADKAPITGSGPYAEIASAIPIVLINLTNFTGLVSTKDNHLPAGSRPGLRSRSHLRLLSAMLAGIVSVTTFHARRVLPFFAWQPEGHLDTCSDFFSATLHTTVFAHASIAFLISSFCP